MSELPQHPRTGAEIFVRGEKSDIVSEVWVNGVGRVEKRGR